MTKKMLLVDQELIASGDASKDIFAVASAQSNNGVRSRGLYRLRDFEDRILKNPRRMESSMEESSMAAKSKVSNADDVGIGGGQDVNSARMSTNGSDEEEGTKPNEFGLQARDGASVGAVDEGNQWGY